MKILVLGSSNVDLVVRVARFHRPGETIAGGDLLTLFGGKGANQAVAANRLGASVSFVTKLGVDHYGKTYHRYLTSAGLSRRCILQDKRHPTGVALIEVDPGGENRIVVSPGANASLSRKDLKDLAGQWKGAGVFLTQLEIPLPTVHEGLKMAKAAGAVTLLNPSPAIPIPRRILSLVDFLVPNRLETETLTGIRILRDPDLSRAAERFMDMGIKNVVITLGAKGVYFKNREEEIRIEAFRVKTVDSTSAGDAFMGALACGLSEKKSLEDTLVFASAAGALAATRLGAQPSLPSRTELERFLVRARTRK